jgi:hypothetical protein
MYPRSTTQLKARRVQVPGFAQDPNAPPAVQGELLRSVGDNEQHLVLPTRCNRDVRLGVDLLGPEQLPGIEGSSGCIRRIP